MTTILLNRSYAPWEAAGDENGPPVLASICFDPEGWAVACNKFILAMVPTEIRGDGLQGNLLVPAATVQAAVARLNPEETHLTIEVPFHKDNHILVGDILCKPSAGIYPDWRELLPALREEGEHLVREYDPNLVLKLLKAIGIAEPEGRSLWLQGESGFLSVLYSDTEAFGAIMAKFTNNRKFSDLPARVRALFSAKKEV